MTPLDTETQMDVTRFGLETDEELFQHVRSGGGEEAFHLLYQRHAPGIFAYCIRMLGSRDDAKDVFQECFIRLYRKALTAEAAVRVAPYLYTIARNRCLTALRDRKHTVPAEEYTFGVEDTALERTERAELVRLAIELLPLEFREPLILRQYNDLPYADIAEILGIPISTVKIRLYRAKEKLRTILAPYFTEN
ncbi:MAG: RNA polymerase sigma factor [Ignavibacteriae bacterium]|nr:RNA polymerase sigma factor [Ignavibacteriota bacterium]